MTTPSITHKVPRRTASTVAMGLAVSFAALLLSACANGQDPGGHVAGWAMIDPAQRHPILIAEEPAHLSVPIARGADGLNPHEKARFANFLARYRGSDTGNGKLTISVPAGSSNEIAALQATADMRAVIREYGIDDSRVSITPYHSDRGGHSPIRVSYTRFVAEAPECGTWPANLGDDTRNLPYADLGCSTQRNLAMQVANPADLLGPRTMTPRTSERRDVVWDKFLKGDSTIAKRDADETASTKTSN
jgi:pilus assembly protein CpaD